MDQCFLPFRSDRIFSLFSRIANVGHLSYLGGSSVDAAEALRPSVTASGWMDDLAISVSSRTSSLIENILFGLWITGMLMTALSALRSSLGLRRIRKSALPLQNREVRNLYKRCLEEMGITKRIPLYSTAFITSPVITGFLNPCIYLPIRLISDHGPESLRYMLLHELQHYRHRDNISNYLLLAAGIFYWFNPFVWLAARAMRNDREAACDAAVLNMLDPASYQDYGSTLIDFAEKLSLSPFPFSSSLGGTAKQLQQRILHIAAYKKPSCLKRARSIALFAIIAVLAAGITPALASNGVSDDLYQWDISEKNLSHLDLSSYWTESTLKVSAVEQVGLLKDLCQNNFGFSSENIQAVRDSLCLASSAAGTLYSKTGTGRVEGQDISGWFVGFVETAENTYFFATNIQSEHDSVGSRAAEITLSILSDLDVWRQ